MLLTENYERIALFPTQTSVKASVELICSSIVVCWKRSLSHLLAVQQRTAISSC